MRGDQLARQWKIIQHLLKRSRGFRAQELAAELDTSVRNIYRDLEALQAAGFPLYTDAEGREAYWRLTDTFRAPKAVPFTTLELMAMEVVRKLAAPLRGTLFETHCEAAFGKIRATMTDGVCEYLDGYSGTFSAASTPCHDYGEQAAVIRVLQDGLNRQQTVAFDYHAFSTGEESRRRVDPYGLFHHQGTLYLVARSHLRDDLRLFTVDRMRDAELTDEGFARPADFDLDAYTRNAFGAFVGDPETVRLRFGPTAARYIRERIWHGTQQLAALEDGGCELTLTVPVSGEIEAWILSWGGDCQVLSPASLRSRVAAMHQAGARANGA